MNTGGQRFLSQAEVTARVGLSRTTIWRLERRGLFPAHRQLSANRVGWVEAEIDQWIATRPTTHQSPAA
jgi:predicted DNA-binding transcriptional regulator AlpA